MTDICYHCALEIDPKYQISAPIQGTSRHFCCSGCACVCGTIFAAGLDAFYTQQQHAILPSVALEYPLEFYDCDAFQQPFLEQSEADTKTLTLLSDGIHCAACVWLIERAISDIDGVIWVRANLTDKRIKIHWKNTLKLSVIIQKLADLGYASVPYEPNIAELKQQQKNKKMLYRIGFAAFAMMNLLWISIALYSGANEGKYHAYFQWLGFALATPTLFYAGFGFLQNGYFGIKNRFMNMDVPISIGALSTYFYSIYVLFGFSAHNEVYFDTVVNFIFVILIGRYLEASSKKNALSAANSLKQLRPKIARVKSGNTEIIKPIDAIAIDEIVCVKSGERIAMDGVIIAGTTEVDESLMSGESLPIYKGVGDLVLAGTMNTLGSISVKVSKLARQSALAQIVDWVENTKAGKSRIVRTVDKIIPYFVSTTLILAFGTFFYWLPAGFDLALLSGVSVLIITCPCAFGLATPMSVAVASSAAATFKTLIKNGDALETLHRVKHVVFDKTGTLTLGKFQVDAVATVIDKAQFIAILHALEVHSEHPLSRAIMRLKSTHRPLQADNFKTTPGRGICANIEQMHYQIGTLDYLKHGHTAKNNTTENNATENNTLIAQSLRLEKQGKTCIWCADEQQILGFVALSDSLKTDAKSVVAALKKMGKNVIMLSGDSEKVAQTIAQQVGIEHVIAGVLPRDKARHIARFQQSGQVLMIGDGINDAGALIQSDTSIAIGSGSDVSVQQADTVILKNTLTPIVQLMQLSAKTQTIIHQNIGFALGYNALMVPLAMAGFVSPLFAAIAMPISSLIVISNAARLKNIADTNDKT